MIMRNECGRTAHLCRFIQKCNAAGNANRHTYTLKLNARILWEGSHTDTKASKFSQNFHKIDFQLESIMRFQLYNFFTGYDDARCHVHCIHLRASVMKL